jgi:hypothetical protein
LAPGDTNAVLTGALSRVAGANVGTYAIGQGTLAANANYTVSFTGNTLTITPAPLTIQVDDASKMAGQPNPDFDSTIMGLLLGDQASVVSGLAFATSATTGSPAGTYAVTSSGGTAANYTITSRIDGTLTVTGGTDAQTPGLSEATSVAGKTDTIPNVNTPADSTGGNNSGALPVTVVSFNADSGNSGQTGGQSGASVVCSVSTGDAADCSK